MGKFLSFLLGFLLCVLIVGAVAFWLLFEKPAAPPKEATTLQLPAGKGVGPKPVEVPVDRQNLPKVAVVGQIELAPHIQALVAKAKNVSVRVIATPWEGGIDGEPFGGQRFEDPKWPLSYVVTWNGDARLARMGKEDLGVVSVKVAVCLNIIESACGLGFFPRFEGRVRSRLTIAGGLPVGKGNEVNLKMEPLIVNKVMGAAAPAECVKDSYQLSGQVQPTAPFLAGAAGRTKVALVMLPHSLARLGTELVGPGARRPTPQRMKELISSGNGMAYQMLTLNGQQPLPFSMKVPTGMEGQRFDFLGVICKKDEDELACASRVFPLPEAITVSIEADGWYRLVPKGFELPYCGQKGVVLYLHQSKPGVKASMEAYRAAGGQPELVDGLVF